MIPEIIGALVSGGVVTQVTASLLRMRAAKTATAKAAAAESARIAKVEADADITMRQHVDRAAGELFDRYKRELDEQVKRHREELDEQARKHAAELEASADKLTTANARADAAELESERERSRRREAERERDEERARRVKAEHERDLSDASVRELSDMLKQAVRDIDELKRARHASGEMNAVSPQESPRKS